MITQFYGPHLIICVEMKPDIIDGGCLKVIERHKIEDLIRLECSLAGGNRMSCHYMSYGKG